MPAIGAGQGVMVISAPLSHRHRPVQYPAGRVVAWPLPTATGRAALRCVLGANLLLSGESSAS